MKILIALLLAGCATQDAEQIKLIHFGKLAWRNEGHSFSDGTSKLYGLDSTNAVWTDETRAVTKPETIEHYLNSQHAP